MHTPNDAQRTSQEIFIFRLSFKNTWQVSLILIHHGFSTGGWWAPAPECLQQLKGPENVVCVDYGHKYIRVVATTSCCRKHILTATSLTTGLKLDISEKQEICCHGYCDLNGGLNFFFLAHAALDHGKIRESHDLFFLNFLCYEPLIYLTCIQSLWRSGHIRNVLVRTVHLRLPSCPQVSLFKTRSNATLTSH